MWTFVGLAYVHLNAQVLFAMFAVQITFQFRLVAGLVVGGVFVLGFTVMAVVLKCIGRVALEWLEKREGRYRGVGLNVGDLDGGAVGVEGKSG